ncbi:hypothetical protein C0W59_19245 [Photobacterium kishitanii]|uniref:hypothetical protein n=1 Tax=Photobacterium kishitanii TaxID=318456 RepID=UPI000D169781|nr:hypothetical protein [Photobacterium kishitanii]PSV11670.1 hypothetical protein C0W59_19245 [Photobacterium kishitanii]
MLSKHFDPNKSFLSLKILWLVVGVLVVISCIISGVISYNSKLYWDFSADGFNCFISLFRFPLGISALIIPIVALLAANHRSEQTKKQIELANTQNVFQNYYKHVEEFTKYVNSIESKLFFSVRKLHKYLYPYSKDGRYFLKIAVIEESEKVFKDSFKKIRDINSSDQDSFIYGEYKKIEELIISLGISKESINKFNDDWDKKYSSSRDIDNSYLKYILLSKDFFIYLDEVLNFDTTYNTSELTNKIISTKIYHNTPNVYNYYSLVCNLTDILE